MKFFFEGSLSPKTFNFFVKHNHRKPFPNGATDIKIRYFFLLLLYSDATKYAVLMTKVQISNILMTKEDQKCLALYHLWTEMQGKIQVGP